MTTGPREKRQASRVQSGALQVPANGPLISNLCSFGIASFSASFSTSPFVCSLLSSSLLSGLLIALPAVVAISSDLVQ